MAAFVAKLCKKHGREVAIEINNVNHLLLDPDSCTIYFDGKKVGVLDLGIHPMDEWAARIDEFIGQLTEEVHDEADRGVEPLWH